MGAGDNEPAGWKAAALPLPHAATPARAPAARTAADPRRPRMVPPWRMWVTALSQPGAPPAGISAGPALTQIHLISYRPISAARSPYAEYEAGLFMAFFQARDRSWVRLATLVTLVTVAAVLVRFGLEPQTPPLFYPGRGGRPPG